MDYVTWHSRSQPLALKEKEVAKLKRLATWPTENGDAARTFFECWSEDWPTIHAECAAVVLLETGADQFSDHVIAKLLGIADLNEILLGLYLRKGDPSVRATVYVGKDGHGSAIVLSEDEGTFVFITQTDRGPFDVQVLSDSSFHEIYKPLPEYDARDAARVYIKYARYCGASEEALTELNKLSPINEEVLEMVTRKKVASKVAAAKKAPKAAKKPASKTAKAKGEPKKRGPKGESAAQLFQALIMEGKLTDDQIFHKVQEKYNLDDNKRSYVAWYRNHLKKQGKKPPEAKK